MLYSRSLLVIYFIYNSLESQDLNRKRPSRCMTLPYFQMREPRPRESRDLACVTQGTEALEKDCKVLAHGNVLGPESLV